MAVRSGVGSDGTVTVDMGIRGSYGYIDSESEKFTTEVLHGLHAALAERRVFKCYIDTGRGVLTLDLFMQDMSVGGGDPFDTGSRQLKWTARINLAEYVGPEGTPR